MLALLFSTTADPFCDTKRTTVMFLAGIMGGFLNLWVPYTKTIREPVNLAFCLRSSMLFIGKCSWFDTF